MNGFKVYAGRCVRMLLWLTVLVLWLSAVFTASAATGIVERWDLYRFSGSYEYGGGSFDRELSKPYDTYYLYGDGTAYSSSGGKYTWMSSVADGWYALYDLNGNLHQTVNVSDDGFTVSQVTSSPTYVYTYYRNLGQSDFQANIDVQAESYAAREEITFTMNESCGVAPCSYSLIVKNEENGQTYTPKLTYGNSRVFIFEEPGRYYAYVDAVDADLNRSDCAVYPFTITERNVTSAVVNGLDVACSSYDSSSSLVHGEPLNWSISASGGAGDLTYITYICKDGELVARYESDSPDGSMMIEEPGAYQVYARVRDESIRGYSDMVSSAVKTSVDPFAYNVVTDGEESYLELTEYRGHLETLVIPSEIDGLPVRVIGSDFVKCDNDLIRLVIPEGVTELSEYAFRNCSGLESIVLPDTLAKINRSAFAGCTALKAVKMGANTEALGDCAFEGCTALSKVTLNAGLQSIGGGVFRSCTSLAEIELNNGLVSLDCSAFDNTAVTRLELPDTVTEISNMSTLIDQLTYLRWTAGIPEIPGNSFYGSEVLETLVLPEGVTKIQDASSNYVHYGAFYENKALKEISLPDTLTYIGRHAFNGCTALTSFTAPENLTGLGSGAFGNCTSLAEIKLNDGLPSLNCDAFHNTAFTRLLIPDTVTKISSLSVLVNQLTYLRWTAGIPEIPGSSFQNSATLETLVLPEGVTKIQDASSNYAWYGAFYGNKALKEISLPGTLTYIGRHAFADCSALTGRICLPVGMTGIANSAFGSGVELVCPADSGTAAVLTANGMAFSEPFILKIPDNTVSVEAEAFAGSDAEMAVLPEGCVSVGSRAFADMPKLHYLALPDSLSDVADDAFEGSPVFRSAAE